MQPIDFGLHAGDAHLVGFDRQRDGIEVGFGIGQQLLILLGAEARRLFLQLEFGDALTQRIELAFECQAPFVAGAQLEREVVVLAARGAEGCLAFQLERQRVLQAGLRRRIGEPAELGPGALFFVGQRDVLLQPFRSRD